MRYLTPLWQISSSGWAEPEHPFEGGGGALDTDVCQCWIRQHISFIFKRVPTLPNKGLMLFAPDPSSARLKSFRPCVYTILSKASFRMFYFYGDIRKGPEVVQVPLTCADENRFHTTSLARLGLHTCGSLLRGNGGASEPCTTYPSDW